jgi:hypothetical protein
MLRHFRDILKPDGLIAFRECDLDGCSQGACLRIVYSRPRWGVILARLKSVGAEWNMGSRLLSAFLGGAAAAINDYCAASRWRPRFATLCFDCAAVRSLLPLFERAGIAAAEEVAIDTLADRRRDGAIATECVTFDRRTVFICSGGSATVLSVNQHPLVVAGDS